MARQRKKILNKTSWYKQKSDKGKKSARNITKNGGFKSEANKNRTRQNEEPTSVLLFQRTKGGELAKKIR